LTLLRHAAALLVGAVAGLSAVAVHRTVFPAGLLLAVSATFAVAWWLLRSRRPRTATTYSVGWLAVLGVVIAGRPEGDYAISSDVRGYALMLAGLGLVAVGIVGVTGARSTTP
jgi:hypothetical protein